MKKWNEIFYLLFLRFYLTGKNIGEEIVVFCQFYTQNFHFLLIDMSLRSYYFFSSPFSISKKFLKDKGEKSVYVYGETPLTTFSFIVKKVGIKKNDTVAELGAGRGRTCFWLSSFIGCKVIGIEQIPYFVKVANQVIQKFSLKKIEFHEKDILETDLNKATFIYLYGSTFSENFLRKLTKKCEDLKKGTQIITVSLNLQDYGDKTKFRLVQTFQASFPWGTADVYHIERI